MKIWAGLVFLFAGIPTSASATWYTTTVCGSGTATGGGSSSTTTVCWTEAYWVDDGFMPEIDPIGGPGGGGGSPEWYYYDSDADGRMDCWKDTTDHATNNSPYGQSSWRFHYGMDIGSALTNYGHGAPVRSIASGQVTTTGNDAFNGNYVRIRHHDGYESVYSHLLSIDVPQGAWIAPGYQIGTMNCTGSCTSSSHGQNAVQGTHLHLEIKAYPGAPRDEAHTFDPEQFMPQCD